MVQEKNGFTLVELIISIAIFGLVSGAITYFMIAGGNNYSYTKGEVNLQTESQIIMAQMNDMLREANYATYDSVNHALSIYKVEESVDPATNTTTKSVKDKKVIYWDNQSKSLYFQEFTTDVVPNYADKANSMAKSRLFSEYMAGFEVVVNESAVTVKLDMKTNNNRNRYKADNTISMRSRLIAYP